MESHFDVLQLQSDLSQKVKTIKVDYLHGFMNFYSNNYNQVAFDKELDSLQKLLEYHTL